MTNNPVSQEVAELIERLRAMIGLRSSDGRYSQFVPTAEMLEKTANMLERLSRPITTDTQSRDGETAMQILDTAVKAAQESGSYSSDTEYDDAPFEEGPFRSLLIEAFGNGDTFAEDEDGERFFDTCYWPFKQRTGQC